MKFPDIFMDIISSWNKHDGFLLSAAFSFYALISIVPLLYVFSWFALWMTGDSGVVFDFMERVFGGVLNNISMPTGLTIVSVLMVLYGSIRIFTHVKKSLNKIWEVDIGLRKSFMNKVYAFLAMFIMAIFIPLFSIIASWFSFLLQYKLVENMVTFFMTIVFLFLIYKFVPDADVDYKGSLVASFVVSILFAVGKYLIGLYLSRNLIVNSFGTAGSIVMFVLWIYYFSLIFFFGAELSRVI